MLDAGDTVLNGARQQRHPHGVSNLIGKTDIDYITQTGITCQAVLNRKKETGCLQERIMDKVGEL